ncbi:glycoside hydrolase domain-containing protein [Nocardioides sp. InS609-2]|uniref:glycoside hydrolase domain-containing protein n=1 Tax=Nocardioides sp. InS609-2 TaxID=2760705 RepID=UPI0020BEC5E3|nr:glycoside hydrolase domain-containing protein [Nocardioides sp. InS609-2]
MRFHARLFSVVAPLAGLVLTAGLLAVTSTPAQSENIKSQAARRANVVTPGDFTGYGFDQCLAPDQAKMDIWLQHSPFLAAGIYISGDSRACRDQPNLSPTWISTQLANGWRLLPIALGPQASCQPRFPRYKDDFKINPSPGASGTYSIAQGQGSTEADKNIDDALVLGIAPGSTIWYDLEGFDLTDTQCRESALRFIHGWTTRVTARGFVAGMYSSAGSGIKMIDDARAERPGQFTLPSRIWIARWDGIANTSTSYIREDGWRPGGRMKQYLGGHNETWGGATINIDSNFLDLGRGSVADPESWCGGLKTSFWSYPRLTTKKAKVNRVKVLQCMLAARSLYDGKVNGRYNKRTRNGIAQWQAARGRKAAKAFTRSHWVSLLAEGSAPVLKVGSAGADVFRLQRALNATGRGKLAGTGVYDQKTESAVRAYQKARRLSVTGTTTPEVWAALAAGRR